MNNVITSGPVLPFAGTDENWFPVRITSVLGPTTYTFQEVWLTDAGLSIADRLGGNSNTSTDPAYPIDGSTFTVTAAGTAVQCLARRAPGLGGVGWELKGFRSGSGSIAGSLVSGSASSAFSVNSSVIATLDGASITFSGTGSTPTTATRFQFFFSGYLFNLTAGAFSGEYGVAIWDAADPTPTTGIIYNPVLYTVPASSRIPAVWVGMLDFTSFPKIVAPVVRGGASLGINQVSAVFS